jgi:hypothetical protein
MKESTLLGVQGTRTHPTLQSDREVGRDLGSGHAIGARSNSLATKAFWSQLDPHGSSFSLRPVAGSDRRIQQEHLSPKPAEFGGFFPEVADVQLFTACLWDAMLPMQSLRLQPPQMTTKKTPAIT